MARRCPEPGAATPTIAFLSGIARVPYWKLRGDFPKSYHQCIFDIASKMPMSRDEWNSCEDHLLVSVAAGTGNTKPHSTKHRDGITRILWLSNIALACICILLIINTLSVSRLCPSYGSNVHDEIIDTYCKILHWAKIHSTCHFLSSD